MPRRTNPPNLEHVPDTHPLLQMTRRTLLAKGALGLGTAALGSLIDPRNASASTSASPTATTSTTSPALPSPHHAPKAKRVIYLMMGGGPSHVDLFDPKPVMHQRAGEELPDSLMETTRRATTQGQKNFPVLPGRDPFVRYGDSGTELSSLIPHIGSVIDDCCLVRSAWTEAVNHAPAVTFNLTGSQIPGRPTAGAWASYGLGSMNEDLPSFVVMTSRDRENSCGQLLFDHYWGSGFLPAEYQGVKLRGQGDPVLYLNDPPGVTRDQRGQAIDDINTLNHFRHEQTNDPETAARIAQYELAYRMQMSVPELTDLSGESQETLDLYGPDVHRPGSFARHCLLARRLAERDVRFIQLMHAGWDQHSNLAYHLDVQCQDTDQPSAGLIKDLKRRGMLDDTLVIWSGEFGRTPFAQGNTASRNYGRDHHGNAFSFFMAGGGTKPGVVHGQTDDFAFNIVDKETTGVHVHDFQATLLHLLGINHERLTYRHQGRDFRLTDVHGRVVHELLK
ncbi:DUF1501 domain-containing protein [Phycisphaeraceae bacterium D3-23]